MTCTRTSIVYPSMSAALWPVVFPLCSSYSSSLRDTRHNREVVMDSTILRVSVKKLKSFKVFTLEEIPICLCFFVSIFPKNSSWLKKDDGKNISIVFWVIEMLRGKVLNFVEEKSKIPEILELTFLLRKMSQMSLWFIPREILELAWYLEKGMSVWNYPYFLFPLILGRK